MKVLVANGDGIGPEIVAEARALVEALAPQIEFEEVQLGEKVYLAGEKAGVSEETMDKIRTCDVLLKGPIKTPQGSGFKSVNVTLRKSFNLFANIRPVRSLEPILPSPSTGVDMIIVRENEEDLYAGIEHRQTQEVTQCLKLITQPGSERLIRYAFEVAKAANKKSVTCMSKDNIMKITDGLFHKTFDAVAQEHSDIESSHQIIDIGSARLAARPHDYDVIVLPNLYGDIVSDIAAEVTGSVGLCGSANIGPRFAMFEAIHGTAPDIAGQNKANPVGLMEAAMMMLDHLGLKEEAEKGRNAILATIESGVVTGDLAMLTGGNAVSTSEFGKAVLSNVGKRAEKVNASAGFEKISALTLSPPAKQKKELVGIDVFIDWDEADRDPNVIGQELARATEGIMKLKMITNRGVMVYPRSSGEVFCTDHWRCRFKGEGLTQQTVVDLYQAISDKFDVIKTENLYTFDGQTGYSLAQGE